MEIFLNSLHKIIIKKLEEKRLVFLKKPFLELIKQNTLSGKNWNALKKAVNNQNLSARQIQTMLEDIFEKESISFKKTIQKPHNDKTINQRVKKHRLKQSKEGLKTISFALEDNLHQKLKKMASEQNMSYSQFFSSYLKRLN